MTANDQPTPMLRLGQTRADRAARPVNLVPLVPVLGAGPSLAGLTMQDITEALADIAAELPKVAAFVLAGDDA